MNLTGKRQRCRWGPVADKLESGLGLALCCPALKQPELRCARMGIATGSIFILD